VTIRIPQVDQLLCTSEHRVRVKLIQPSLLFFSFLFTFSQRKA